MLKNLAYVALLAGFISALIGVIAILQQNKIFVTSRAWLLGAGISLLVAICFVLLSIDNHLEKRP
ncbi:MAG TPA: hypothetical protein VGL91_06440 [Acidobacteriota bacterium]|jgi:stage V sporulation protein SpoVS